MILADAQAANRTRTAVVVGTRILVGIDGSPESLDAARQAARLLEGGGTLTLMAAYDVPPPTLLGGRRGGIPIDVDVDLMREQAERAVHAASAEIGDSSRVDVRVVHGSARHALFREAEREHATLIAVGSHGRGRMAGIALGSTATALAHNAPCSVLVARAKPIPPTQITVGVDGSRQSLLATEVALDLATRLGGVARAVVAIGDPRVDVEGLRHRLEALPVDAGRATTIPIQWRDELPVEALVAASTEAGLLVVGGRGLHGLAALRSVSERVAHRARCSVLIVRDAAWGSSSRR